MALKEREKVTWLSFKKGKIAAYDDGKTAVHAAVEGVIVGVSYRDREFESEGRKIRQRALILDIQDGNEKYRLTERRDSSAAMQLQNKLLNTQPGDVVEIFPGSGKSKRDEVVTNGCFVKVDGVSIKQKYSKDNPGECPQWKRVTVNGQDVWDHSEQSDFLEMQMLNHFDGVKPMPVTPASDNDDGYVGDEGGFATEGGGFGDDGGMIPEPF